MRRSILTLVLLLALAGCDAASSTSTGPTFTCTLNQGDTGPKTATSGVGDSTQNCTKSKDSHNNPNPVVP